MELSRTQPSIGFVAVIRRHVHRRLDRGWIRLRDWAIGDSENTGRVIGESQVVRTFGALFERVVAAARKRLKNAPRRAADEEDIAVSVFASLCRGAAAGRFKDVHRRDDLWRVLLAITHQKAVDRIRREVRQKRGGGAVRGESVFVKAIDRDDRAGRGFSGWWCPRQRHHSRGYQRPEIHWPGACEWP